MNRDPRILPRVILGLLWGTAFWGLCPHPASAAVNHRPSISWLADQRRTNTGGTLGPLSFTVGDAETAADSLTLSAESSNPALLPTNNITLSGSASNRTATLAPVTNQWGWTTVTLTVSDGAKTAATAFTLTVATNYTNPTNTAPVIQDVANVVLPTNVAYGSLALVVKDEESAETSLTLSRESSNPTLAPTNNIVFGGQNWGRSVTVTPASGQIGRATITLAVSDGTNTARTAFVLDVVATNTPPTLVSPTNQLVVLGTTPTPVSFTVGDAQTAASDLLITGTSANTNLLRNENIVFGGSGSNRTVTLTPQPGLTGASMVTLSVMDHDLSTNASFLLVVHDPTSPTAQFQRPRGIYILDSPNGGTYTTTFGTNSSLRDGNMRSLPFVDGFTLRIFWNTVEGALGQYDFYIVSNALNKLPAGQKLSLILQGGSEPAYIAATPGVTTWNDAGDTRPVPWDPVLQARYAALVRALANYNVGGIPLAQNPRLVLLDPYLPGGFTGFRDPTSVKLQNIAGYARTNLLNAGRNTLLAWQTNFPGKMVQIGFWKFSDTENAKYDGVEAWEWVRQQILTEFNEVTRPRVGFFMENLAAKRSGAAIDPYTATPITSFGTPMYLSQSNTWNGFQMLGSWTRPFNDGHVDNTLNGTPADAMEHAYNTYRAEYHEVYIGDIDNPAMQPLLTRWHEFYATGITTANTTTNTNGPLAGFTLNGNNWTYDPGDGGEVITGILMKPSTNGLLPAVLISHGQGGTAQGFAGQKAQVMTNWGLVCIGPNYTHTNSSYGAGTDGWSPENARRAKACLTILGSLNYVDMSRVGAYGNSKGAFVTAGLCGAVSNQIRAAAITAGGTSGTSDTSQASPALSEVAGIVSPFLLLHASGDTTVYPYQSANLQAVLNSNGVPNQRLLFQGGDHNLNANANTTNAVYNLIREWFTTYGVLQFTNSPPSISSLGNHTLAANSTLGPLPLLVSDSQTSAGSLVLQCSWSATNLANASSTTFAGSGANRTVIFTPLAGVTGAVTLAVSVYDGQLSDTMLFDVMVAPSNAAPSISALTNCITPLNTSAGPLAFTIGDPETAANDLLVAAVSDNPTLVPASRLTFGGTGSNRSLTLSPANNQAGTAAIAVSVSDGSRTASTSFSLIVFQVPLVGPLNFPHPGQAQVQWSSQPGVSYQMRYSPDLKQWFDAGAPVPATNSLGSWIDDGSQTGSPPGTASRRFYRVRVTK